jgi:hypothetical protein
MIDAASAYRLQEMVRREGRSLLQYVADAFPWTSPGEQQTFAQIQQLVAEERAATKDLALVLVRGQHRVPYLGAYPMAFTTMNFVSLDYLLPLLVEAQRRAIDQLHRDAAAFTSSDARTTTEMMIAMKQRHLKMLEALATNHQPASAGR